MTLAELNRAFESKERSERRRLQERASFDYVHAILVGNSVARIFDTSATIPQLHEVYPHLYDEKDLQEIEEKKQEQLIELSAIRFRLFADSHNKKIKEVQTSE